MADIQITFTPEGEQDSEKVVLSLNIRKTLDGNIIVRDHSDIDIVIVPSKRKIVTFPKDTATEETYVTQNELFKFLQKRGVILPDSIQGGNVFASLEAKIPENDETSFLKTILMVIAKFIEKERPYFEYLEAYEKYQEERLTEPSEAESSEYDPSRHSQKKGTLRPTHIRSPYGVNFIYEEWEK